MFVTIENRRVTNRANNPTNFYLSKTIKYLATVLIILVIVNYGFCGCLSAKPCEKPGKPHCNKKMNVLKKVNLSTFFPHFRWKHTLPELPYEYSALEPTICREIMELHHQKHHAGYVEAFNSAEDQLREALVNCNPTKVIQLGTVLRFNGGGHINHSLFWENLSPHCTAPSKALESGLKQNFYSQEDFKLLMRDTALSVQGSGWVWLGWNKPSKTMKIVTCCNQDPLEATTGLLPLLGIDLWEHAYYIQYKNDRAKYFDALWDIIDWKVVSKRYEKLRCLIGK